MHNQVFQVAPALTGNGFEEFLDSYRSRVPEFKAQPEGNPRDEFRWCSEAITGAGVTSLACQVSQSWTTARETDKKALNIFVPLSGGRLEASVGGQRVSAGPNTAILGPMSQIYELNFRCYPEFYGVGFVFGDAVLTKVLNSICEDISLSDLNLTPVFDLSTGEGANLFLILQSLALGMRGNRLLEQSPKSMALLSEAALLFMLGIIPNRAQSLLRDRSAVAMSLHINDAIDYMHANIHKPLTITDIAKAAGVSVRSLQLGFQQHKNTTPRHYLRRIRLEAVHAELMQPDNMLPVSKVALKWGFSHLGRFAAQYRARYGVSPSETLKSARAR